MELFQKWGLDSAVVMALACHTCAPGLNPGVGMWQGNGHPSKVGGFRSAQSRNGYNSGIVPAQSRNSHFAGRSKNSYLARFNSGIVPAQSRNRDKVRIYYFPAQSRNRGQSKNICVIIIIIIIIYILFREHYN